MFETIVGLLKDKSLPGTVLLALVYQEFGPGCFDWEPEILRAELTREFGVPISDLQSDKLQAAITVLTTDQFENNWHIFNTIVHCLNSEPHDSEVFDEPDAEQITTCLAEVQILRNELSDSELKFDPEVRLYAGFIFSNYGLLFAPSVFPTAIIPELTGDYSSDSQTEKQEALWEIYNLKKEKIHIYLNRLKSCYLI